MFFLFFLFLRLRRNPNSNIKKHARLFGIGCFRFLARCTLAADAATGPT